jgi:hypothetical protein
MKLHGVLSDSVVPLHGAVVTLTTCALSGGSENSVGSVLRPPAPLGQNTTTPINVAIAATPTADQIARATFVSATNSGTIPSGPDPRERSVGW